MLDRLNQIAFICTAQRVLRSIQQVSLRRNKLLDVVFAEIEILNECFAILICSQSGDLTILLVDYASHSIRMNNVLFGIEAIGCALK